MPLTVPASFMGSSGSRLEYVALYDNILHETTCSEVGSQIGYGHGHSDVRLPMHARYVVDFN